MLIRAHTNRRALLRSVLIVLAAGCPGSTLCAYAQQAPPTQTPPIAPKTQETPLPPPVTLPPPPSVPPDVPNRPLTAEEAARIALFHQPNITVAQAGVLSAQGITQQARSGLYPNLGVGAGYTNAQTISAEKGATPSGTTSGAAGGSTVTATGYQASANLRQLLFDFNHTRDLVRQAQAQERAATQNLTRTQSDTVLQVKQAFYGYVQADRLVTVNETNVRNAQAHLDEARARLNSGLGLPSDVVRAQTAVADAILNLNLARNAASVARVNLATFMGIDPRTPVQAADTGEPAVAANDVNALVGTALRQRPEILQAQSTLQAAQFGVSAAKTTSAPSIAANIGLATRGASFPPRNDFFSWGFSLSWDPFDSGLTAGRVKEAQAGVLSARAQLFGAEELVTSDVSQAYLNLRTAEQRITTADAEVANAQESLRLAEGRYRAGIGTFIDVIDAQAALLTAQNNRINAQSAIDQARAAINHALGVPLATSTLPPMPKP